jgi:hypothetical protein
VSDAIEGGCHCRAVRYRIDGPIQHSCYCHCRMCQLTTGAPVTVSSSIAAADFRYTQGKPSVYRSSESAIREFCGTCGASLTFHRPGKSRMGVNTATFDDPSIAAPTLHIWTESRIAWFETTDEYERREKSHW